MGLYDGWRVDGYPTLYPALKSPVTADVLEVGLFFAIACIAFSLILVLPGVRGKERWYYLIRVLVAVFVLGSVLLTNFGQEWDVAEIHNVTTQYRAGLRAEIHADVGVKISLRSINVTLKGNPVQQLFDAGRVNETIDYNERFHWDNLGFVQGRIGFGPFASLFNREFREAQWKGAPYPILWVAEYFTIDGEGIRWGRYYRQAGFYTVIMVWCAFPLWIITLILAKTTLRYAGYFSLMTGGCLVVGNILYATIRNPVVLEIPFATEHILRFHYGWCFWLNLATGLLTILIGLLVIVLDMRRPESLATFFDFDVAQDYEDFYADPQELQLITERRKTGIKSRRRMPESNGSAGSSGEVVRITDSGQIENPNAGKEERQFRKRSAVKTIQKSRKNRQRPEPAPRARASPAQVDDDDDRPDYENWEAEKRALHGEAGVSFTPGADNLAFNASDDNRM